MRLDINGKPVELKLNFGFIERMDKRFAQDKQTEEMGIGLAVGLGILERTYSPAVLADVIHLATDEASKKDVKEAIEEYAEEEGTLEPLFEEVIDAIKKAPMLTATLKKMNKLMDDYMENV